jgi:hypothetical protein
MTLPTAIPPQVRSFSRKAYQHDSACFMQRPSAHMMRHGPRARTKGAIPSATTQLQLRVNPTTAAAMPVTARPCGDRIQERSLRWVVGRSPLCTASGLPVQQFISFVISVLIDHMGTSELAPAAGSAAGSTKCSRRMATTSALSHSAGPSLRPTSRPSGLISQGGGDAEQTELLKSGRGVIIVHAERFQSELFIELLDRRNATTID